MCIRNDEVFLIQKNWNILKYRHGVKKGLNWVKECYLLLFKFYNISVIPKMVIYFL